MKRLITSGALCSTLAAGLVIGCANTDKRPVAVPPPSRTPSAQQTDAMAKQTMDQFMASLLQAQTDIDRTLSTLGSLTDPNQQDLRGAYEKYCDSISRMEETSQTLKTQADAMRTSHDAYFANWEEKTTEIENPTIRAGAEARGKRLRDANDTIVSASCEARDAYGTFISDAKDIKSFLMSDLSKPKVSVLGEANKKVQGSGTTVKEKLLVISNTLTSVKNGPPAATQPTTLPAAP